MERKVRVIRTHLQCAICNGTRQRFYHHLMPGGMLILDGLPTYEDAQLWPLWRKDARTHVPEPWPEDIGKRPADDHEYELRCQLVAVDPLEQRTTGEMRMLLFKNQHLAADDTYTLTSNYYFRNEMQLVLEKAGFTIEAEKGDWTDADIIAPASWTRCGVGLPNNRSS